MAIIKPISGHGNLVDNHCRDYLLGLGKWESKYHGKRCNKVTYINILPEEAGGLNWDAQMDNDRIKKGTNKPLRNDTVRTYNHYIFSPNPKDNINEDELEDALKEWVKRVFQNKFSIVIGYHNDNTNKIQHAHMYINNINWSEYDTHKRIGTYVTPQCWEFANQLWQYMCEERGWHSFLDKQVKDTELQKYINQGIYEGKLEYISEETENLFEIDKEYFKNTKYFSHDIDYRRPYKKISNLKGDYLSKTPFSTKDGKRYTKGAKEAKLQGKHLWTDDIRDLIEISYYQSNNIVEFTQYLSKYDIKINITKDKDFKFTHPDSETWVVTGKKLGNDYTRAHLIKLFNEQNNIDKRPHKPNSVQNANLIRQIREIGYTLNTKHIGYIDSKTQLTLNDLAKTMKICSVCNCWNNEDFERLNNNKISNEIIFAKETILKLESLENIRYLFEQENPQQPKSYADIESTPKETLEKSKIAWRRKIIEKENTIYKRWTYSSS